MYKGEQSLTFQTRMNILLLLFVSSQLALLVVSEQCVNKLGCQLYDSDDTPCIPDLSCGSLHESTFEACLNNCGTGSNGCAVYTVKKTCSYNKTMHFHQCQVFNQLKTCSQDIVKTVFGTKECFECSCAPEYYKVANEINHCSKCTCPQRWCGWHGHCSDSTCKCVEGTSQCPCTCDSSREKGWWAGEDCNSCAENFDIRTECTRCVEHATFNAETGTCDCHLFRSSATNCSTCLPKYRGENCLQCVDNAHHEVDGLYCECNHTAEDGYWVGDECDVCKAGFTVKSNCTQRDERHFEIEEVECFGAVCEDDVLPPAVRNCETRFSYFDRKKNKCKLREWLVPVGFILVLLFVTVYYCNKDN